MHKAAGRKWEALVNLIKQRVSGVYLACISILGLFIVFKGILQFPTYEQKTNFFLLIVLAALADITVTYFTTEKGTIAYEVGTAVSLAAVPFYGPFGAAVIGAASGGGFWLFKTRKMPFSKKNWEQLAFNIGMLSISVFAAGTLFLQITKTGIFSEFTIGLVWLISAVVYDQVNLWLLIGLLKLLRGREVKPVEFWLENRWAMVVNISILSVGGFLISSALASFQWLGIVIFYFPILLSTFSFQLYVRKMQAHLDNLENIIAERTKELSMVVKEKDAYLAVLTHDMKTPLTTIGLYANLLDKNPEIILEKKHLPQRILRSQEVLTEIVDNILDLEKLAVDGQIIMKKEILDLIPILEDVTTGMEPQAQQKNIELGLRYSIDSLEVYADRQQIERILRNLISNAIKYTPTGGIVSVDALLQDTQAVIKVRDSGYGIPVDELPFVFDRFRRVAKHEQMALGTGLGLAITKALVEAHNGTIFVDSQEDAGSVFTVELPAGNIALVPS